MKIIGEVNKQEELCIDWRIENFFALSKKVDKRYRSPIFSFAGASWFLEILPNGELDESEGFIGLYLNRASYGAVINLEFTLGLKKVDETIYAYGLFTNVFESFDDWYGCPSLFKKTALLRRSYELAPSGLLLVFCRFKCPNSAEIASNSLSTKCFFCKTKLEAHEDISTHQEKCMDKSIKCLKCSDVVSLKDFYYHTCQTEKREIHKTGSEKVISNLKEIMLSGDHSDVTVKVKEEEIRLHRSILAARNPYFHAMFKTDMLENKTGVIAIDDCEPDVFRSFIHFVYTGAVDKLSSENVCGLCEVANKYQEDQLKKDCLEYIVNTLSVDNLCDFVVLALRQDEKKLLQDITEFFATKTKEVIKSVKWQTFLLEYPIQANELLIKALEYSEK